MLMTLPARLLARLPIVAVAPSQLREALRGLLTAEQPRVVLWLPVGLASGVIVFFGMAAEPGGAWFLLAALSASAAALALRRPPWARAIATVLAVAAAGAALAQFRTQRVAAPVLAERWGPAELTARIVSVEIRPEGTRAVLDDVFLSGVPSQATPARVRLKLRAGQAPPPPGTRIAVRAQLVPPPEPLVPGGYDFARRAWFERLGAVGSARGPLRVLSTEEVGRWRLRLNAARTAVVARVLSIDAGPAGQVTAALLTGEMGHIQPEVMNAMRDSGLAHLLSISGLHISLVGGIVFFALRRLIALAPPLALRCPAKKIAALGALLAITAYALFAAPGVPTMRAWFMGAIVLIAVMLDRAPLSMRLVAWAAAAIIVAMPEAVLGPSFQMSFAAVVALIAAWEALARPLQRWSVGAGIAMRGLLLLAGSLATTLIASCATAPFALYHFNRVALFSVAANLLAVPLTSILVMPAAVLVLALLPFGMDAWPLAVMNAGNALVVEIAKAVAAWPGAAMPAPAMPDWGLASVVLGGCWLCLWRTAWRLAGVPVIVLGLATPWIAPAPDLLVSGDGRLVAWHDAARGSLALQGSGNVQLARETWVRRVGASATSAWPRNSEGALACGGGLCWIEQAGHRVAVVLAAGRLSEACAEATLLVTPHEIWRDCPTPVWIVDRAALARAGAHTVTLLPGGGVAIETVRSARGERRWVRPARTPAAINSDE
jgi:competence protein ComEC